jgi:long-chain acyl-CoA synthetase
VRKPYPRGVPYSINYPEIPVYAFMENSARKFPNRDATIFLGARLKYAELWDQAKRLAAALQELGLKRGDRVSLLLPNVPQFPIAYNAVLAAGGVVVALNPLMPSQEIGREIEDTDTETLIVLDRLLKKLPDDTPEHVIVPRGAG